MPRRTTTIELEPREEDVSEPPRTDELVVEDNPDARRYEARLGDDVAGTIVYVLEPGRITLIHTEVDPRFEGQGIASRLAAGALDDIRGRGLALVPMCSFVRSYLGRHPEYADLVAR
jgi:predicted GNAT family acetyltransferase